MFCAGLLLSIADLLELRTHLPRFGPDGRFKTYSMSLEAFPLPQEQWGVNRASRVITHARTRAAGNESTIRALQTLFNS